jgi:4-carboxymuconolactone decarboxylase
MARVPIRTPAEVEPEARAVLERIAGDRGDLPRVYGSLANSPRLFLRLYAHVEALWKETTIPRTLQELVILRVAQRMGSDYEWGRHRLLAGRLGVPEEQVPELAQWRTSSCFDERERAALELTDAIAATGPVPETSCEAAGRIFSPQEIVEIAELAAFYVGLSRYLAAVDVTLEPGFERLDGTKAPG